MAEREPGLYWVKVPFGGWEPARWDPPDDDDGLWYLIGEVVGVGSDYLDAIGERVADQGLIAELRTQFTKWAELTDRLQPCLEQFALYMISQTGWPEPLLITDAQKNGERFLVWLRHPPHDDTPGRWVIAGWGIKNNRGAWTTERFSYTEQFVTHYLPLPPDVKL